MLKRPHLPEGTRPRPQRALPAGERVLLVDEHDRPIGSEHKLRAHTEPRLHRAFSIFLADARGHVLLQQRAPGKYHSGGLWSNACCGHPRPGEDTAAAAARRLWEELGIAAALQHHGTFIYRAEVGPGLVEHELDHLFTGEWTGAPRPDPAEVLSWRWVPAALVDYELRLCPHRFTAWFEPAWQRLRAAA